MHGAPKRERRSGLWAKACKVRQRSVPLSRQALARRGGGRPTGVQIYSTHWQTLLHPSHSCAHRHEVVLQWRVFRRLVRVVYTVLPRRECLDPMPGTAGCFPPAKPAATEWRYSDHWWTPDFGGNVQRFAGLSVPSKRMHNAYRFITSPRRGAGWGGGGGGGRSWGWGWGDI